MLLEKTEEWHTELNQMII